MAKLNKIILSVFAILVLAAGLFYFVQEKKASDYQKYLKEAQENVAAEKAAENLLTEITTVDGATAQKYENTYYGFSVIIPSDYTMNTDSKDVIVSFISPQENEADTFAENFNILTTQLPENMTLDDYKDSGLSYLQAQVENSKIISVDSIELDSVPAYKIIHTGKQNNNDMQWEQVVTIKDGRAYVLSFVARQDTFADYSNDFDNIVNSFRWSE